VVLESFKRARLRPRLRGVLQLWWEMATDVCGCESTGFSQSFIDDNLLPDPCAKSGITHAPDRDQARRCPRSPACTASPTTFACCSNRAGTYRQQRPRPAGRDRYVPLGLARPAGRDCSRAERSLYEKDYSPPASKPSPKSTRTQSTPSYRKMPTAYSGANDAGNWPAWAYAVNRWYRMRCVADVSAMGVNRRSRACIAQ